MNFYQNWCIKKAKIKEDRLTKFYTKGETILDIGSGNCSLNLLLKQQGHEITGVDISNKSAFKELVPVVYDGISLPFKDNEFDVVQLITVLHHIKDPEQTIREAIRVGNRIIIMEDIFENTFQKYVTYAADSVNNWEFVGHPHTNKNDAEWKEIFSKYNLTLEKVEYYPFLLLFKQATYILTKNKN